MKVLVSTAILGACLAIPLTWPNAAPAIAVSRFADAICHAKPPRLSHAWAASIRPVASASVIRVADIAAISNEDQADLLLKLGLMEGHLRIGKDLIAAKHPELALPHFGHPVRELYGDVGPELDKRGLSQFDGELVALEALAAGKPGDQAFNTQFDKVMKIVAAVRATVPAPLLNDQAFMLGVLTEVATVGAEDYNESIEGGKIAKPVEYHDSRGYLEYADTEMQRLKARPELQSSTRLAAFQGKLNQLRAIVGPLLPPKTPIKSVADYKAIVGQMKATTGA